METELKGDIRLSHRVRLYNRKLRLHLTVEAEGRVTPWHRETETAATRGANYSCLGDSTALLTLMTLHFMASAKTITPPTCPRDTHPFLRSPFPLRADELDDPRLKQPIKRCARVDRVIR